MKTDITAIDILKDWMNAEGYTGLLSPDGREKCECQMYELVQCACDFSKCIPIKRAQKEAEASKEAGND